MLKKKNIVAQISKATVVVLILAISVSSCRTTQPYAKLNTPTESLYRDIEVLDTNSMANIPWQELFTDVSLQNLIHKGIENNYNLLSAYSQVEVARAYYLQSRSAILPSVNGVANVDHGTSTSYQLGLTSSWELDIWGKLGSSRRAELNNLLQTEAGAKAVETNLVASIASYYYQLLTLDKQLTITEETAENWKSTVITMKALKEAARVTEAAVVQSEAQQYGVEVTIPDLKQSIKELENTLSLLIGIPPSEIQRGKLDNQKALELMSTGLPAQLLANRPDLKQAELNLRKHYELTNVARASFYPALSITASAGQYASNIEDLLNPGSTLAKIAAGLVQPIFNKRANKTRLEIAEEQQKQAFYGFQSTLLKAGQEVSNAMSLYKTTTTKAIIRQKQIDALELSVDYSQELLENGFANYTEVITAKQSLLQAKLSGVSNRLEQYKSVITLYSSLGGGWR